jgi:hypothetical protein
MGLHDLLQGYSFTLIFLPFTISSIYRLSLGDLFGLSFDVEEGRAVFFRNVVRLHGVTAQKSQLRKCQIQFPRNVVPPSYPFLTPITLSLRFYSAHLMSVTVSRLKIVLRPKHAVVVTTEE